MTYKRGKKSKQLSDIFAMIQRKTVKDSVKDAVLVTLSKCVILLSMDIYIFDISLYFLLSYELFECYYLYNIYFHVKSINKTLLLHKEYWQCKYFKKKSSHLAMC